MKTIRLSELDVLVQNYCNQTNYAKPLMLWFASNTTIDHVRDDLKNAALPTLRFDGHPMWGLDWCSIDGQQVRLKDHPELLSNDILPYSFSNKTKRLLYHRYLQQLDQSPLNYCLHLLKWLKLPVICLVNDYSTKSKDSVSADFLENNFEQYFVLERTYEEWRSWAVQTKEIVPELIEYMDAHKDLFIISLALEGMPPEAVHTIENALLLASYAMKQNDENTIDEKLKHVMYQIFGQGGPLPDNYFAYREDFKQLLVDYFSK